MENKNLMFKREDESMADFVNKLLHENEGSAFLSEWFYDAIIGINEETRSIIYSFDKLIEFEIALRFEDGGLNPDYDVLDNDILIVAHDSMVKLFIMMQVDKDKVPPTLFNEDTELVIDPNAFAKFFNEEEYIVGNKVSRKTKDLVMPSKEFTQDQLEGFINENEAERLRWIELQQFNPSASLELVPRKLISFDDVKEPIIRCVVKLVDEPYWLGFQDLTFDQWELGKVINQEAA